MDNKLNRNQQYALKAKKAYCILGHISKTIARRSTEVILPLSSARMRQQVEYLCSVWDFPVHKRHQQTGVSPAHHQDS